MITATMIENQIPKNVVILTFALHNKQFAQKIINSI